MIRRLSRETRGDNLIREVPWRPPPSAALRVLLLAVGMGLAALLVTAAWLEPNARGVGTHQQLGFPPCTVQKVFNMRCPSCGMTTAWAYAVRGRLASAVATNSGGLLLAVLAMIAAPWSLLSAIRGQWLGGAPSADVILILVFTIVGVTLLDWGLRLMMDFS